MALGAAASPGPPVTRVFLYHQKRYAFLECRSAEEASNAMALQGLTMQVRRVGTVW